MNSRISSAPAEPAGLDSNLCVLLCTKGMDIIDFLNPMQQIRRLKLQEAQHLLEAMAPILSLSQCPCLTLPQVWSFSVWGFWLLLPIPEVWVTLSFSLCLASCFSSFLHPINSSGVVSPRASPHLQVW